MEPFHNVPLNISNSLEQSLDDYVAQQILSDDNLYYTQLYGPQQAKKSVKFLTLPPIIMVQLKRFQFNYYTNKNEKIMHRFQYPNIIDFSKWQIKTQFSSENPCNYELYAVLVHQGLKAQSGHYYAFVKIDENWYRFNDQQVSLASSLQVFEYNFGGEISVTEFDARQFKVYNRKSVSNSTAYMLVYVNCQKKQRLLQSQLIYPQWLKQHQIIKQQQREQLRNRKNYYHDVHAFYWQTNFRDCMAGYLGFVPKNIELSECQTIGKLTKNEKIQQWVKPYNQKGVGVYLYLTTTQKIEYETLVNLQHRKTTFQQIVRDPNCPIFLIFLPVIANLDNYLYIIKTVTPVLKFREQGQPDYQIQVKFNNLLQINRNSRNSQLISKLEQLYSEQAYSIRCFYEEKKQISQIRNDNTLVKGPPLQRNILGIILVQKVHQQLRQRFSNPTIQWYNDLKNFVQISFRSEDGKYSFETVMDQNRSVQSLRDYIYQSKVIGDEGCPSSEYIVLKGKPKKTAKNYMQVTGAKTIRDLIRNCDKQNLIVFSFSNLKVQQRVSQVQIKFVYRFKDFSFSDVFHVILDRKSQNQSVNIYQKIVQHQEVYKYKKAEEMKGIRLFLFSKDRNVINDIVSQNGHVHGKGQIANVLQKQKGSHLVVQGFDSVKIQQNICPILVHHRSQNDQKIGIPRYLQYDRSTKFTQIYQNILQLIKDDVYEWEDKKVKINPMKTTLYTYAKDYNKGMYLFDQQTLVQNQLQQLNQKLEKQQQKEKEKQTNMLKQENQIKNKPFSQMVENNKAVSNKMEEQQQITTSILGKRVQIVIQSSQQQKNKNENQPASQMNGQFINVQENSNENLKANNNFPSQNMRKNSRCEQKIKAWQKTIQSVFGKPKYIKIVIHHLYLTKAQTAMKINV